MTTLPAPTLTMHDTVRSYFACRLTACRAVREYLDCRKAGLSALARIELSKAKAYGATCNRIRQMLPSSLPKPILL